MNRRKLVTGIITVLIVLAVLIFIASSRPTNPRPRVFIRSNGDVEPSSAPIQRNGEKYTFTGDVYAEFVIERGGVMIDGAGFTLHGPYNGTHENLWVLGEGADQVSPGTQIPYSVGVDLGGGASGLTISNLNIKNFSIGTYIWTDNNTFVGNSVTECVVGVLLSGTENSVVKNYMVKNEVGLFFGSNEPGTVPLNLTVSRNSFENNVRQLGGCLCQDYNTTEPIHNWDDGKEGNYWSDYNGTDVDGDGIGDTAYVFDAQNQDRFPLINNPVARTSAESGIQVQVLFVAGVAAVVANSVLFDRDARHKKRQVEQPTLVFNAGYAFRCFASR